MARPGPTPLSLSARLALHVREEGACLVWIGAHRKGVKGTRHGRMMVGSRADGTRHQEWVHRIAYEIAHGPIPEGMQINHRCGNSLCVNPDHVYAGTKAENWADWKLAEMINEPNEPREEISF